VPAAARRPGQPFDVGGVMERIDPDMREAEVNLSHAALLTIDLFRQFGADYFFVSTTTTS
jgi:hypothetical protein